MQTKYLYVLIHIWIKGEVGAPWNWFKPSSKIFYWRFQGSTSFVDLLCFCSVLCLLCLCARLFIYALWSPAGKGLTFWLSFVVSNCEFVTYPIVSWVRCSTWFYRFLIFAPLLTFSMKKFVWPGNTTIIDRWRAHGTPRKSQRTQTATSQPKISNLIKKMITKAKWKNKCVWKF